MYFFFRLFLTDVLYLYVYIHSDIIHLSHTLPMYKAVLIFIFWFILPSYFVLPFTLPVNTTLPFFPIFFWSNQLFLILLTCLFFYLLKCTHCLSSLSYVLPASFPSFNPYLVSSGPCYTLPNPYHTGICFHNLLPCIHFLKFLFWYN